MKQHSRVGTCGGNDLATVKIKSQAEEGKGEHGFSLNERNHSSFSVTPTAAPTRGVGAYLLQRLSISPRHFSVPRHSEDGIKRGRWSFPVRFRQKGESLLRLLCIPFPWPHADNEARKAY